MRNFKAYINGEFIESESYEILSPLEGNNPVGKVAALSEEDLNKAFEAANNSWKAYSLLKQSKRTKLVANLAKALRDNADELAHYIYLETNKPETEGKEEVIRSAEYIEDTIKSWNEIQKTVMVVGSKTAHINRVPLGVVLAISPFNYPVNLAISKIAPALLIGNSVVFKPATNGSLTGSLLAEIISRIGFPKGTFNLVTGRGRDIGDALTSNKHIKMISFTGSVRIGNHIKETTAGIPLVLELGGNDAAYIRHDADLKLASQETAKGAFSFYGQRCTAIKRVIVHKDIEQEFTKLLVDEVSKYSSGTLVTPQATKYVEELADDSRQRNDQWIIESKYVNGALTNAIVKTTQDSRAFQEEAFGPLLPMVVVASDDEAKEVMNNTNFGLQNSIFSVDKEWALEWAIEINSGTININRSSSRGPDVFPFSGVKDSGVGTQGISYALESMSRILNIVDND